MKSKNTDNKRKCHKNLTCFFSIHSKCSFKDAMTLESACLSFTMAWCFVTFFSSAFLSDERRDKIVITWTWNVDSKISYLSFKWFNLNLKNKKVH